jgi:hypothetical protein
MEMTMPRHDARRISALRTLAIGLALGCWTGSALAQDVQSCRTITDPQKRLNCYDAAAARPPEPAPPPYVPPPAAYAPPPGYIVVPAPAPGTAYTPTAPRVPTEADFGRATVASKVLGDDKSEPDSITSKIVSVSDPTGKPMFRLANGQLWRVQDYETVHLKSSGDNVATITRPVFGYLLRINDQTMQYSVVRVK